MIDDGTPEGPPLESDIPAAVPIEEDAVPPELDFEGEEDSEEEVPVAALSDFLRRATAGGLFPAIIHGLDPDRPSTVALATTSISELPRTRRIVERVHGEKIYPFRYVPISTLEYVARHNHAITLRSEEVDGFRSDQVEHLRALSHLVHYCTASLWREKAFLLVDMVGFSTRSSAEQLSMRMSLGQAISQCQQRMYALKKSSILQDSRFNRISTGDGFYLWSYDDSLYGHIATFTMMALLMSQVRDLEEHDDLCLQLRGAFGIGEAFIFPYDGPSTPPPRDVRRSFRPDAIGPALNTLSRILDKAYPSQMLAHPFDVPGRSEREGERLDVETMLTIVGREVLPQELSYSDPIKPQEVTLEANPTTAFRLVDKHRTVHHCVNIVGTVARREGGKITGRQNVGLLPDPSTELGSASFVRQ